MSEILLHIEIIFVLSIDYHRFSKIWLDYDKAILNLFHDNM